MLSLPSRMLPLLTAASLSLASACAPTVSTSQVWPLASDLRVEPKPQLVPADLESEAALDAYEIKLEGHGDRGWLQVGRLCRWAERNGMTGLDCPPPPEVRPPDPG